MRFDYWNHPLVVSAFRVRFRGKSPSIAAMIYFVALLSLGGVLHYNLATQRETSWIRIYFVALISIECVIGALYAATSTFQSMHNEVVNRTLDYQRTAAIGPHEILLGKLLGEPAQGYMLTAAGVPLLVWCVAMGACSLPVFALLLVNLVTTMFMFGAVGLLHPLDTSVERSKDNGRSVRALGFLIAIILSIQMLAATQLLVQSPLGQVALGLLLPAVSIYGVAVGDPLNYCLNLFGLEIPYLFVTPIAQVAVALLVLHSIARRLISPLNTALSKLTSYGVLLAADVLAASLLAGSPMISVERVIAGFCLCHLVMSLLLTMAVTPGRETLKTWVWRYRGRLPLWKDMLWGPRSGNLAVLFVFCLIGAAVAPALALSVEGRTIIVTERSDMLLSVATMVGASSVILLALGSLYQFLYSIGRAGGIMFIGVVAMFSLVPHLAGAYLNNPSLLTISPSAQFGSWLFDVQPPPSIVPLLVLYGALFFVMWLLNRRRISLGVAAVERKVAAMLAEPENFSAIPLAERLASQP